MAGQIGWFGLGVEENRVLIGSRESRSNISSCSCIMKVSLEPRVSFFGLDRFARKLGGLDSLNGVAPARIDDLVVVIRSM